MRELTVALVIAMGGSIAQKPAAIPPSGKTDTTVIRGCVSGSLLRDLREQKTEPLSGSETAVVYRLVGEKKLLQSIQKEHQDQVLDVTGKLESNPNSSGITRSKQAGKARIYVGAGRQETSQSAQPSYPTLRVTAFEVVRPGCRS